MADWFTENGIATVPAPQPRAMPAPASDWFADNGIATVAAPVRQAPSSEPIARRSEPTLPSAVLTRPDPRQLLSPLEQEVIVQPPSRVPGPPSATTSRDPAFRVTIPVEGLPGHQRDIELSAEPSRLTRLDRAFRKAETIGAGPGPRGPLDIASNAVRAVAASPLHFNAAFWAGLEAAGDVLRLPSVAAWARSAGTQATGIANTVRGEQAGAGPNERAVYSGLESMGMAIPALAAGAVTANPAIPLAIFGSVTGGEAYTQARQKGVSVPQALTFAVSQAAIEVATEKIPAARLLGDLAQHSGLLRTITRQLTQEIPGEQAATLLQDLNDWAVLNPEKPFQEYVRERPGAFTQTLISTVVGTVGQTIGTAVADRALRDPASLPMEQQVDLATDELQTREPLQDARPLAPQPEVVPPVPVPLVALTPSPADVVRANLAASEAARQASAFPVEQPAIDPEPTVIPEPVYSPAPETFTVQPSDVATPVTPEPTVAPSTPAIDATYEGVSDEDLKARLQDAMLRGLSDQTPLRNELEARKERRREAAGIKPAPFDVLRKALPGLGYTLSTDANEIYNSFYDRQVRKLNRKPTRGEMRTVVESWIAKTEAAEVAETPVVEQGITPAAPLVSSADTLTPGEVYRIHAKDLALDPSRFQYKLGTDAAGVTNDARLTEPWNPNLGGILQVWQDPSNKETYVVNGHHRAARAKADGATVTVWALDAQTADEAKALGAQTNIAEGRGTPIDVATLMRQTGITAADFKKTGISPRNKLATQGAALAQLSGPLFDKVATGTLSEVAGVAIGQAGLSPEGQAALATLIDRSEAKGRTLTPSQMTALAQEVEGTAEVAAEAQQTDIYGVLGEERTQNLAVEKAVLRDWLTATLAKDKRLFGFVAKKDRAGKIAGAGVGTIDTSVAEREATAAGQAHELVQRLAHFTGPLNTTLTDAATRILAGEKIDAVRTDLLADAKAAIADEQRGVPRAGPPAAVPQADTRADRPPGPPRQEADRRRVPADSPRVPLDDVSLPGLSGVRGQALGDSPARLADVSAQAPADAPFALSGDSTPLPAEPTRKELEAAGQGSMFGAEPANPDNATSEKPFTAAVLSTLDDLEAKAKARIKQRGTFSGGRLASALPVDDAADLLIIGAAKIMRGAITFGQWSAEMVAELGESLRPHLQALWRQSLDHAGGIQNFNPEDYFNFKRVDLSDDETQALRAEVISTVIRTGRIPKEKVTFADIRAEAQTLHPDMVKHLAPFQEAQAPYRAVRDAARHRINVLNQEVYEGRKALIGVPEDERLAAERDLDGKEADLQGLLNTWMRLRSEDGRNLAMHRMMADAAGWDYAYWSGRAKRALGLPPDVTLPPDVDERITALINDGRKIQEEEAAAPAQARQKPTGPSQSSKRREAIAKTQEQRAKVRAEMADAMREFRQLVSSPSMGANPIAVAPLVRYVRLASENLGLSFQEAWLEFRESFDGWRNQIDAFETAWEEATGETGQVPAADRSKASKPPRPRVVARGTPKPEAQPIGPGPVPLPPALAAGPRTVQAQQQLSMFVAGLQRTGLLETIAAVRKAGLLTGIKTHLRNIGGNTSFQVLEELSRLPAVVVDMALAVSSGQRTVQGASAYAVARSSREAATAGVKDAAAIMRTGVSGNAHLKVGMSRPLNSGYAWLDTYANTVFRTMSAEDAIFKSYAFRRSIEEQAVLIGQRTGQVPVVLLAQPTPAMVTQAIADAEFATFNNENVASSLWQGAKGLARQKGAVGRTIAFGMDIIVPFTNTPANILARVIDYTPIGGIARSGNAATRALIAGHLSAAQQRTIALAIGRGMVGTAVLALGWMLAQKGVLTGGGDDDEGDRNVATAAGRLPGALLLGERWHTVNAFSPLGNLLVLGSTLHRQSTRPLKNELTRGVKIGAVAAQTVLEQPMLQGMQGFLDAAQDPGRFGESYLSSNAGSFVPTLVSDAASLFDPYRRDVRPDGFSDAVWKGASSRLPGLRNLLPERIDVLGRTLPQSKIAAVLPTLGSPALEQSDPIIKALVDADVGVGYTRRQPKETDDELRARSLRVGRAIEQQLRRTVASPYFEKANLDRRRDMLEFAIANGRRMGRYGPPTATAAGAHP